MERLVLIDGSALIFRAYFAIPANLATKAGLPTNAIFGFATMFKKLMATKRPTYGAVIFDAKGGTFRDAQYPGYKAQRPVMASELSVQLPWIDKVVAAHGFPMLRVEGYEADDVIGTLTERALAAGLEVHILSGDKDFNQLVGDRVKMIDPMREITYDAELVRKKFGVPPGQFVDLLALMGDTSDNIPGVAGIGQKTASALLAEHGNLDNILAAAPTMKGKVKAALTEHADTARLSRSLATIDRAVPTDIAIEHMVLPPVDTPALDVLFKELEFWSLVSETRPKEEDDGEPAMVAKSEPEITAAITALGTGPIVVEHLRDEYLATRGTPLGIALSSETMQAAWIPLPVEPSPALQAFCGDATIPKLTHGEKALSIQLRRAGYTLRGVAGDTQLASFLIEPTKLIPHELDAVSREHLQKTPPNAKLALGAPTGRGSGRSEGDLRPVGWAGLPEAEQARYAVGRARIIAELWPVLKKRLEEQGQMAQLIERDLPLVPVLAKMEEAGILVDADRLGALEADFSRELASLEQQIHTIAGRPFNIASTKQLGEILFDEMKLPVIKRNKTGYSTDVEVLEKLAPKHPIAKMLLDHRKLQKLITTYTRVLVEAVDPADRRIHATFQQTIGATGRLITTDPDLQRTPVRTPEGKRIRQCFIAPQGMRLISADWSQIELRVLAHVSGDPRLVAAFARQADVHKETAAQIFGITTDQVTSEQRNVGKTINFATIYGQGANALGQILGIAKKDAQAYIEGYFAAYAGVRTWLDSTIAEANKTGFVTTLLGRKRYIAELSSRNFMDQQAGERIAANTPIQGSAADLCKLAMLHIDEALRSEGLKTRMLLMVHDELVFEAPEAEVDRVVDLVRAKMRDVYPLSVPLVVDVGVGKSWADAKN